MKFRAILVAMTLVAGPAIGQSIEDAIIQQLQSQGFTQITVSRTFLGRIRIDAYSNSLERELIINPNTGEVLRDHWEPLKSSDGDSRPKPPKLPDPHDDEDDEDDVGGDDDDDDDSDNDNDDDNDDDDDDKDDDDDDDE